MNHSIHDSAAGAVALPATVWELRPTLFKIVAWLYATFPTGVDLEISNATIKAGVGISEGTVSPAMPELEQLGFLTREWDPAVNGGRGGYITILRPPPGTPQFLIGSNRDGQPAEAPQTVDPRADSVLTPETPISSLTDHELIGEGVMVCHDSSSVVVESAHARVSTQLPPAEHDPAWHQFGLHRAQIAIITAAGWVPARFRQALAFKAAEGARNPLGCVYDRIKEGLEVIDARPWAAEAEGGSDARGAGPARPPRPSGDRPPAHQRQRPGARRNAAFADPASYYDCLDGGLAALGLSPAPA